MTRKKKTASRPPSADGRVDQTPRGGPAASMGRMASNGPAYAASAILSLLVLGVYWQAGAHPFIFFDDNLYVSGNHHVLRGLTLEGASWAFTSFHAANWHPLTWLSHMLDVELFGPAAGWHHRMNVVYHLLNTELLFLVLWRMTGGLWRSAFVAALFGVHPLHVESVAWVAERKDVLSTLFWILATGAYLRYTRRPGAGRYLLVAAAFALGLMCKPMLVTLPLVLLLLDWWPLGRMSPPKSPTDPPWRISAHLMLRRAWEKVPLLGLSAVSCAVTYLAQVRGGSLGPFEHVALGTKISNAIVSYAAYLWKTVWPARLAVFYPHPALAGLDIPAWKIAGSAVLLGGLSLLAVRQGPRRPWLAAGWLWFLGTLVPVIGVVQAGSQALADRYAYMPLVGLFIAVAWDVPSRLEGWRFRRLAAGVAGGAVVAALSASAWIQTGYWRDEITLFSRTLAVTDRNWVALNELGMSHSRLGRHRQAIGFLEEAARIMPGSADVRYNLGMVHGMLGDDRQAVRHYAEALRLWPGYGDAWNNMGVSLGNLGQDRLAIDHFREAVRIRPSNAEAWNNMGMSHARLGRHREAIGYFRESLQIRPDYVGALNNLGVSYDRTGQHREAVGYLLEALRIRPDDAETLNNLGVSYLGLGQDRQAVECFRGALRIDPGHAAARKNLALAGGDPAGSR